jgi:DNA helicase-2/ATP-dependent DNA helicase PcrA
MNGPGPHTEPAGSSTHYKKALNPQQHAVVMHPEGPMLVLAGAGTGKTRTVIYRVARLIETGTDPERILLLTFTNKAASEMMKRVESLIGMQIRGLWGGTFHHIGHLVLRRHCTRIGYREGFSILDREDSRDLFDVCLSETKQDRSFLPRGAVLCECASLAKNTGAQIEEIVTRRFPQFQGGLDSIIKTICLYEQKKVSLNLMDFDDLLTNWKRLLCEHEDVKNMYSSRFVHLLVDEYQDTNRLQAEILALIASHHGNLMAVGDDAQSIYSFRGADFENILKFSELYPDAAIFHLTTNYRSVPEILNLANMSILNNTRQFQKQLLSVKHPGALPSLAPFQDVFQQAAFIAERILDMHADGTPLDDIAVLYRSHYQSMELQMQLQARGVPFEVRSGLKFFEQTHIKDILSFLRILINPSDELSWKRILKLIPGIGDITAGKLWDALYLSGDPLSTISGLDRHVPKKAREPFRLFLELLLKITSQAVLRPSSLIGLILNNGYEAYLYSRFPNASDRIEDIEQMKRFGMKYSSVEDFSQELSLLSLAGADVQSQKNDSGHVILSTVHQAKGLEWGTVFLIGLTDGRFPSARSLKTGHEEEERRLFYVGITRAQDSLILCYPAASEGWHAGVASTPSRFLRELPFELYEELSFEETNGIE